LLTLIPAPPKGEGRHGAALDPGQEPE